MSNDPILITGASGKTGRAVAKALRAQGQPVRALIRRPEQAVALEKLGASEIVVGDMTHPASLDEAARGTRAIYHICPNMHPEEVAIGQAVIGAARRAGCERLAYHSVLHPQVEVMPHHWRKLRVEEQLFKSGLSYTILQPCAYMQNILTNWGDIVQQGHYRVPYSVDAQFSLVDLQDVAEAAAVVLSEAGHEGAIYELNGPMRLSSRATAEILAQQLEREVEAVTTPLDQWQAQASVNGLPPATSEQLLEMFRYYDRHGFWGSSRVLQWLLGRPPSTFATFVDRTQQLRTPA